MAAISAFVKPSRRIRKTSCKSSGSRRSSRSNSEASDGLVGGVNDPEIRGLEPLGPRAIGSGADSSQRHLAAMIAAPGPMVVGGVGHLAHREVDQEAPELGAVARRAVGSWGRGDEAGEEAVEDVVYPGDAKDSGGSSRRRTSAASRSAK